MKQAITKLTINTLDFRTREVAQQVGHVNRVVCHGAAARKLLLHKPAARTHPLIGSTQCTDIPDGPAGHQLLELLICRAKTTRECRHE